MGIFLVVLLILAGLALLYILWCLTEPFFLINDKVRMKRSSSVDRSGSELNVKKLPFNPKDIEGTADLRLFFFSDIHNEWCPVTAKRICNSIRRAHKSSGLDAVIFGGDLVTYPKNAQKGYDYVNAVRDCCKELGLPFYGISGNHDFMLENAPAKSGFISLDNSYVTLSSGKTGARIYLAGVPDSGKVHRVWQKKLACNMDAPVVLLAHNPDSILHLDPEARPDFMLSGHFHGGQMKLPFKFEFNVLRTTDTLPKKNVIQGQFDLNGTKTFISRGLGCGILPFRFLCVPEATVVEIYL